MQMYTEMRNTKKLKELYQRALTIKSAIPHPRIMGIIRECGGKMHMHERLWSEAATDFFEVTSAGVLVFTIAVVLETPRLGAHLQLSGFGCLHMLGRKALYRDAHAQVEWGADLCEVGTAEV